MTTRQDKLKEINRLIKIQQFKDTHPRASWEDLRVYMLQDKPEEKQWLFYYSVFTHVHNKEYKTVTEAEVKELLKVPGLEIHYLTVEKSPDRLPEVLKGRKVVRENVDTHEHLGEYIYNLTGVMPNISDLMLPQVKLEVKEVPLVARLRAFNKSQADQKFWAKWTEETRARFMACLQSGKSQSQCMKDCNIKTKK